MANEKEKILSVRNLVISFKTDRGIVHAVRGVSFDLYKGETLCIVGESGSGKSVTNKAVMGISSPNAIVESGQILFQGEDLTRVSEEEFHRIRGNKIGMIFQDPLSALNPTMKIGKQIMEAMIINRNILKKRYSDIISNELVALRNAQSNRDFERNKAKNEIKKIKSIYEAYSSSLKDLNECEYLAKGEGKADFKTLTFSLFNKVFKRKVDYSEKLDVYFKRVAEEKDKLEAYFSAIDRQAKENLEIYSNRQAKNDLDLHSENISNLKKFIYTKMSAVNNTFKKYYGKVLEDDYLSGTLEDRIAKRIAELKKFMNLVNKETKMVLPYLKKDLRIKKKEAKVEVKAYKEKLKAEYESEEKKLSEERDLVLVKIEKYRSSLPIDKLNDIDEILKKNEKLRKIEAKKATKFQENQISKTDKNSKVVYLDVKDENYKEFLEEVAEIDKKTQEVKENYINKTRITYKEAKKKALEVMKEVGIPLPERRFKQYPFEFSGGMRQRIVIAIALTANPEILICDEPTTALDVTIQAQILELINRLKVERNLSCIFITHDLGVVANMADRVAVMYAGKIVEYGTAEEVFIDPRHPYTRALLSSIPDIDSKEKLEAIPGTPPDMIYPPKGDAFALRSKYAMSIDFKYEPPFFKVSPTHYAATWLLYPGAPKVEMPKIVKTRIENEVKQHNLEVSKNASK
jgi:oligopeptide/dipeptide ABC transporter ATP-binding protein